MDVRRPGGAAYGFNNFSQAADPAIISVTCGDRLRGMRC